jgi:hypothetical protein
MKGKTKQLTWICRHLLQCRGHQAPVLIVQELSGSVLLPVKGNVRSFVTAVEYFTIGSVTAET